MSNCREYKVLIDEYIDGSITDTRLAELKRHTEQCESCRREFNRFTTLQDVVRGAFSARTSAQNARDAVLAEISAVPARRARTARAIPSFLFGRPATIAAGILLAAGLSLGFALGRLGSVKPARESLEAQVPIRVARLEGAVMARHKGSDLWQTLRADSSIHLGDTFHSAASSGCVLEFEDKSTIELSQNSMLTLESYNGQTCFYLEHGECTAALESPHSPFFVSTPHGRVEALGTEFTVKVE
jgi:hypothetical protein